MPCLPPPTSKQLPSEKQMREMWQSRSRQKIDKFEFMPDSYYVNVEYKNPFSKPNKQEKNIVGYEFVFYDEYNNWINF